MATALVKKTAARSSGAKIAQALDRVAALTPSGQDAIANLILETLDTQPEPAVLRFRELIEQKYVAGLSPAEAAELQRLETELSAQDDVFYSPVLTRVAAGKPVPPVRSRSRRKTQ